MWMSGIAVAAAAPVEAELSAVVLVRQGSSGCAGVHLGEGRIATAYHCVASGGRPAVQARTGVRVAARVEAADVARDLAVLSAPGAEGWPSLALSDGPPPIGTPVRALGHPYGEDPPSGWLSGTLRWSASEGEVSAVGDRMLQITAPLNPGNSGGPIVDPDGRVVGIASRRLLGEGLGFASRSDGLGALIDEGRPMSPLGGTLSVHGVLLSQTGADTGLALGARGELAIRDRVVVDVAGYAPLSPRWIAARTGASASVIAEARGGLRQRLGRGSWACRIDAMGGIAALRRLTAEADDPFALRPSVAPVPSAALGLQVRSAGLELGWSPGITRAAVILRWPGVVEVF